MTFREQREKMVKNQLKTRGVKDALILDAMMKTPRHEFVPPEYISTAYDDCPLPIGFGQTISQPYMVAVMTEKLRLKGGEKILEIGTGSGYQTAVLAEIAGQVYTIERHAALAARAEAVLRELGYSNVRVLVGDGTIGLEKHAPFDGIIVTAGAPYVPQTLKKQLAKGGRLVIPVGGRYMQSLHRVTRKDDAFNDEELLGCVFVPLIGEEGWRA